MTNTNKASSFYLYLLLTAIALAAFLVSLDGFIVNVAITPLSGELGVRRDEGTWTITLFSTASTLFVAISGYLFPRFGNRHIFLFGLTGFMFSSLLAGFSQSFEMLLVARTLQGASAGLITPVSLALIVKSFPPEKRAIGIGFWSFFVMVGPAMGPMIGGWLANDHWRWMFFLNVPVCLFSLATVLILLEPQEEKRERLSSDWMGIFLLLIWVGALQTAMNRWNIDDWFRSPYIVFLFIVSIGGCLLFLIWELTHPAPFFDCRTFGRRDFLLPSLSTSLAMGLLFSSFVLDSLWVQEVLGYTPGWAGLTLAPVGLFPLICYPLMGKIASKLDFRLWVIGSFILYAITFFWLSEITVYTAFWQLALPRLIQGIGFSLFTIPNASLVIHGVPEEHLTRTISLYSFTRMFSVGFAVAGAMTLWIFRTAFYQTRMTARAFPNSPLFQNLMAPFEGLTHHAHQSLGLSYETIVNEASTLALADIYYLYGWLFLACCLIPLFYKMPKHVPA